MDLGIDGGVLGGGGGATHSHSAGHAMPDGLAVGAIALLAVCRVRADGGPCVNPAAGLGASLAQGGGRESHRAKRPLASTACPRGRHTKERGAQGRKGGGGLKGRGGRECGDGDGGGSPAPARPRPVGGKTARPYGMWGGGGGMRRPVYCAVGKSADDPRTVAVCRGCAAGGRGGGKPARHDRGILVRVKVVYPAADLPQEFPQLLLGPRDVRVAGHRAPIAVLQPHEDHVVLDPGIKVLHDVGGVHTVGQRVYLGAGMH